MRPKPLDHQGSPCNSFIWGVCREHRTVKKTWFAEMGGSKDDTFILSLSLYSWHIFVIKWYLSVPLLLIFGPWNHDYILIASVFVSPSTVSTAVFNKDLINCFVHVKRSKTLHAWNWFSICLRSAFESKILI